MKHRSFIFILLLVFGAQIVYAQRKAKNRLDVRTLGQLAYSSNQSYVGIIVGKKVAIYSSSSYDRLNLVGIHTKPILAMTFSPDGRFVTLSGKDNVVETWDYVNNKSIDRIINLPGNILNVEYLSSDKLLFQTKHEVLVYDAEHNKIIETKKDHSGRVYSIAVAGDGKSFASGGADGKIILYDASTFKVISSTRSHKGMVRMVKFSPDGKFIGSGDNRGKIVVQNLVTKEQMIFNDARGWLRALTFSDDGKYLAAGDDRGNCFIYNAAKKSLQEKITSLSAPLISLDFSPDGTQLIGLEQFKSIQIWNVSDLEIAPTNKLKDMKDRTPPQIFVANPPLQNDLVRFSKDLIDIRGTIIDESGVRSLKLNDLDVPLKENGNFVAYLPLSMGDNPVTLEAKDVNDNIAVKKFTIQRKNLDGEVYDVTKARNFLVVIGIDDYNHWPKLNNAVKDANDVTGVLMERYNFKFDNVTLLRNEQATRNNIYKSLRSLIEKITPQDNLMIYYSGHGYFDELLNEGYWIPVDANIKSAGEYLSNSDILKLIGNMNCQHTFLVADACFSGSLFADSKRGYAENVERFKSRWGLASGRLEVVSDGEIGNNSPFATAVIQFLKENQKEKVAISELVQFVKLKVSETSNQTPLGNPLKVAGDEGGELVLYKKQD